MNKPLGQISPGLTAVKSKTDRMAEALQEGLKIPWMGVRPDLKLHKGAARMDNQDSYVLEDPVRGSHFELGEAEAKFFLCLVTEKELIGAVKRLLRTTSLRPSLEDVLSFARMLQHEKLAILPSDAALASADFREQRRPSFTRTMLSRYLFFKIPLFRPDGILSVLYPWVSPLWSKPLVFLYAVLGVVGTVFMLQQIELYLNTVNHLFTPRGALSFALCLSFLKTLHEFGHAFAAKHYGLFVRRMGIALMVFIPILYTDVTDAWKLTSRRGRLIIGSAGILVEICVAAVSLFFWSILPEGILKSLMFFMSGTSLVSTVFVNLNPLMRFDGYYILMDYLRVSNLRTRALEMFRFFRRRILTDWQGPKPEEHPWEHGLALFGLFTMIYRIMIFLGITLTIYHKVFKALGVVLVLMQIIMMILLPILMETRFLLKYRQFWGSRKRVMTTAAFAMVMVGLLLIPLPSFEKLPAFLLYQDVARLESPGPGRIVSEIPKVGEFAQEGDLLVRIHDDGLAQKLEDLRYDLYKVSASLENIGSGGVQGGYRKWLLAERQRLEAATEEVRQTLSNLEIRAPMSGRVLDVNEALKRGAYVKKNGYVLAVGGDQSFEVHAYASENRYRRLLGTHIHGGEVIFRDLETPSVTVSFRKMLDFPVNRFPNESLFDYAGGDMVSSMVDSKTFRSRYAHYPLLFSVGNLPGHLRHGTPCYVEVRQEPVSLMREMSRWVWRNLAAEGFV